jgi:VCBS repeat-containing protein
MVDAAGATATSRTLTITIQGANDTPLAVDDSAFGWPPIVGSSGSGRHPTGNVLPNDRDVDSGDGQSVSGIRTGTELPGGDPLTAVVPGTSSGSGVRIDGTWGWLNIGADGSYLYEVDFARTASLAPGVVVQDYFTYELRDTGGLTDLAQLTVNIRGRNNPPIAVPNLPIAVEAGGIANGSPGIDPAGDITANDFDFEGDPLSVDAIRTGPESGSGTAGTIGSELAGTYGWLTQQADGTFTYRVDNANPLVEALRSSGDTLTDFFTYTVSDIYGAADQATIAVTIRGANDNPLATHDTGTAVEAGGLNNGTPGSQATGNVLLNDTDVDNCGHTAKPGPFWRSVPAAEAGSGTAGSVGSALTGTYGALTLNANGTYTYVVDNANATVQMLRTPADTLSETFTYTMRDTAGATDIAQLTITLQGANDTPLAVDDSAFGWPPIFGSPGSGRHPTGNVLPNDRDVDSGDGQSVSGIRTGTELPGGDPLTAVVPGTSSGSGVRIDGTWGWLNIGADGSYLYEVDFARTASLAPGVVVQDYFTYELRDTGGLTDLAQLTVNIRGRNNPPIAVPNLPIAVEAGGIANGSPGIDPAGDITANDFDFEGDPLSVDAIRTGPESGSGTAGTIGSELAGTYGWLTQQADGTFTYRVDNANPLVEALRSSGDTLTDFFTYTVSDIYGAADQATIAVTIRGANDNPLATHDTGTALEAGGLNNGTPGSQATGNVLLNDTDVDAAVYGETKAVSTFASGGAAAPAGSALTGAYGTLTLNADGGYTYVVDNSNTAVEALRTPAETLDEIFTYTVVDAAGATATATLTITIQGANDTPLAVDDSAFGWPPIVGSSGSGRHPTGNVLPNDRDVDSGDGQTVSGIRTGTELPGGDPLTAVVPGTSSGSGVRIDGTWGWLNIGADGSYLYEVDFARTASLAPGVVVQDYFTYELRDTDGLTDLAQLTVNIRGRNNPPIAVPNLPIAVEAGGIANGSPGIDPAGDITANDFDFEGDPLSVDAIRTGPESGSGTAGTIGSELAGTYGWLTQQADGTFTYRVDNANPLVEALRSSGDTLTDFFTYTVSDIYGAADQATIAVTIRGANDNPLANHDTGTALEAGGLNNGTPGSQATGDVLLNDTDVDAAVYGETRTVLAIRTGTEAGSGTAGSVGSALTGTYGALTLNANGTYTYVVDNANATVQMLRTPADTLSETFTYTMRDTAGATDIAQLTITLQGANDTPLAVDDSAFGWPPIVGSPGSGRHPIGNVLPNDRDVDSGDGQSVSGIRTGTELPGGDPLTAVVPGTSSGSGVRIDGTWGWLNIGADGSYLYEVDFARTASLVPGVVVQDYFTYELRDTGGLTDLAQLTVNIRGRNNPPIAVPNLPIAVEAGGIANGSPGIDPAGDITANDFDFEGDPLSVDAIRTGPESGSGTAGTIGSELAGTYGWLTQQADGTFTYRVDNANPLVEALRSSGDTLTDFFTYTVSDIYGAADQATIAVTIRGANDNPLATHDTGTALEAGGLNNGTPGSHATGDVLLNDTDVDAAVYGETKDRFHLRQRRAAAPAGSALTGAYGTLTLNADGSYTYVVDNANTAVEALRTPAETLGEIFTYTVVDAAGATATATLTITIKGANDNPLAADDVGLATDAGAAPVTSGNVLPNDTDIDAGDGQTVSGIRTGTELPGGDPLTAVVPGTSSGSGVRIDGTWGWLNIGADGSYLYEVDFARTASLAPGVVVQDYFTYELRDTGGLTDLAQLTVNIRGRNNPPIAVPNLPIAVEAGGIANGSPGIDPAGDITANDFDFEGDPLSVDAIRTGPESGSGTAGTIGSELAGTYGWLDPAGRRHLHLSRRQRQSAGRGLAQQRRYADRLLHLHRIGHLWRSRSGNDRRHHPRRQRQPTGDPRHRHGARGRWPQQRHPGQPGHRQRAAQRYRCRCCGLRRNEGRFHLRQRRRGSPSGQRADRRLRAR